MVMTKENVGYDLMPAAVDFLTCYETLGVKFESNPKEKWLSRKTLDGIHTFYYPDRTIYRSRPGMTATAISPTEVDRYLDYSVLTNPGLYKSLGYRYVMISPPHMGFKPAPLRNKDLLLFADSGGFQIRQGVTDFIDPDMLIGFYNKSTDIGIGLDVPMHPLLYPKYLARMAHVTSKNNKWIKKGLTKNVALYDLNHGMDINDRKVFLDVTDQYEPNDGIALAGTSSKARGEYGIAAHIVNGILGISYVLSRSKKRYRTAHILGTTTPFYMFAFHLMTKSGFFPHITSDSSTYAQAAMMNTQLTSIPGQSLLYRNTLPKDSILYRSPCQCPICQMVGYSQHLMVNSRANMIHSLYHYSYLNQITEDLAGQWLQGSIKSSELEKIIAPSSFRHQHWKGTMAFVNDVMSMPFKKAYAKNLSFIEAILGRTTQTSLFGVSKTHKAPHGDEVRTDKILSVYEKWQKDRNL